MSKIRDATVSGSLVDAPLSNLCSLNKLAKIDLKNPACPPTPNQGKSCYIFLSGGLAKILLIVVQKNQVFEQRPLLSLAEKSAELEGLFKVSGNQTRLRMLHALIRAGEMCVTDLAEALKMNPPAISNQLQRLMDRRMVTSRRNGNNIFYKIVDPCVVNLIDRGLCLMEDAKERS